MNKIIKLLKKIKRSVLEFINHTMSAIFRCLPIKNRVFFYSIRGDGKLLENAKCVYDKLPDVEKVIVTKKLPHPTKLKPKIYYYLLTSKVIVTDDYVRYLRFTKLRPEQKLIQIWHACGAFKKFGLDAFSLLSPEQEMLTHNQYTLVSVSAENVRKHYAGAFGIPVEKVKPLGVPRTDKLLDSNETAKIREKFFSKHPELKGKKLYLYAPTFREIKGKVAPFDPKIDFEALDRSLSDDEVFIINLHPLMKDDYLAGKSVSKVLDLSAEASSALLCSSDVLITDYSSIIYDASLLDLPTVFYCPDNETYERDFYLNYPDDLPGEIVTDSEKLLDMCRKALSSPDVEKIKAFKKNQMGACDGNSSERVAEIIRGWLK